MAKHLLLTGATGLVGHYLVRDLLLDGMPLAVIVRPRDGASASERVEQVLAHWEGVMGRALPRPVCLEGDVTRPECGLSADDRAWVARHCGAVLHNAASLKFEGADKRQEPWLTNLTGTGYVLDLCRRTGIRELHYMSTAYVCGRQPGLVRETDRDRGQTFHNDYEQSKCAAELLVRTADCLDRVTVYRPAIIVGDSRTGFTTTYHGLFSYFQFVWFYCQLIGRDADGRLNAVMRLNLTGAEGRNMVPVDWVSAVITFLVRQPRHHGQTYHLTPLRRVTAKQLEEAMSTYFNYYGPRFVGPEALAGNDLNDLETMFYAYVARYQPYWNEEPEFDCTNLQAAAPHLPCPEIDVPMLHRMIEFGVTDRWGKRKAKRPRKRAPGNGKEAADLSACASPTPDADAALDE